VEDTEIILLSRPTPLPMVNMRQQLLLLLTLGQQEADKQQQDHNIPIYNNLFRITRMAITHNNMAIPTLCIPPILLLMADIITRLTTPETNNSKSDK